MAILPSKLKNACVCETLSTPPHHHCGLWQQSLKKLYLAQRSKSKSLTLVSFERALNMHVEYEVSIFYGTKVIANVYVDNRQTNRQDKNNMPPNH